MKKYSIYSDKDLLILLHNEDEKAYETLYERYWSKVYNHAFSYFYSQEISKDIVQELFLKLWESRFELKDINKFESYLFIMSRNKIMTTLRQLLKRRDIQGSVMEVAYSHADAADQHLIGRQTLQQVNAALSQLPARQQLVFRMSREEGLTHSEIAEQLKINRYTVKNHLVHALATLRHLLNGRLQAWLSLAVAASATFS